MQFRGNLPLLSNIADTNYHALHRPKTAVDAHVGAWRCNPFQPLCLPLLGMTCLLIGNALGSQGFEPTGERVPFAALKERNDDMDEKVLLAQEMRNEGKTLQEIADALGYKSISSVHTLLSRK